MSELSIAYEMESDYAMIIKSKSEFIKMISKKMLKTKNIENNFATIVDAS